MILGDDALGVHALSGSSNTVVAPDTDPLAFDLTLNSVALHLTRRLTAGTLVYTATLNPVTFRRGYTLTAEPLNYFLTDQEVNFLTGVRFLPPASSGLNYWIYVRQSAELNARTNDTIYDGSSTGTTLQSTDVGSILRLIATDRGKWFVLSKTGNWTLN